MMYNVSRLLIRLRYPCVHISGTHYTSALCKNFHYPLTFFYFPAFPLYSFLRNVLRMILGGADQRYNPDQICPNREGWPFKTAPLDILLFGVFSLYLALTPSCAAVAFLIKISGELDVFTIRIADGTLIISRATLYLIQNFRNFERSFHRGNRISTKHCCLHTNGYD